MTFTYSPIGIIHSPFKNKQEIQPDRNQRPDGYTEIKGQIEILEEYAPGLQDIADFSHIFVIFAFHKSENGGLIAHPPFDHKPRGVFSTRSPHRPNAIGLTVVRLHRCEGRCLHVSGLDMLEGTPVLDIKPYTPRDQKIEAHFGWLEEFLTND